MHEPFGLKQAWARFKTSSCRTNSSERCNWAIT